VSAEWEQLERLISRELDGECTRAERRHLRAVLDRQPDLQARYDEMHAIDRAAHYALRKALGRSPQTLRPALPGPGWVRGFLVAAAAGLAAMVWLPSGQRSIREPAGARPPVEANMAGVRPALPSRDEVAPLPAAYERPELRWRGTQREWLVIPGDRPGLYMLIEMDQVRTHVIGVHRDY